MSRSAIANWFFDPIISVGFPMPKIAFLPVVILWLGVYDVSKITMIVHRRDLPGDRRDADRASAASRSELIWSARNMGASNRELMWQIVLPAALPQILTGLQVALPISMIVAVVAEMLMGGYGLGGAMMTASRFADSRGVFAGIVEIAIVGYVLIKADGAAAPAAAGVAPGGERADDGVRSPVRHNGLTRVNQKLWNERVGAAVGKATRQRTESPDDDGSIAADALPRHRRELDARRHCRRYLLSQPVPKRAGFSR